MAADGAQPRGARRPSTAALVAALAGTVALLALPSASAGSQSAPVAAAPVSTAAAGPDGAVAKQEDVSSCDDVVVQFEPEGSGGATKIKARNIGCHKARGVARRCIEGDLPEAWSASYGGKGGLKIILVKGERKVKYLPVGGGGCVPG
jgi:hypothetical protein